MAWYAYCISEKQAFPELSRHRKPVPMESVMGISGNQIFLYPASDLAVIVSEHHPSENLDQKAAVEHARVISDCFKLSTVLPFRFGTVFADDEALRKSIRSNQRQFLANVERLRGKAEMHLKVLLDDCCREQSAPVPMDRSARNTCPACGRVLPGSVNGKPRRGLFRCRCTACSAHSMKRSVAAEWIPARCSSTSLT